MKKHCVMILLAFSSILAFGENSTTLEPPKTEEPLYVTIHKESRPTQPRDVIPITCYYVDGVICFDFLGALGEIEIVVTNESSGQQYECVVETSVGYYEMNITPDPGNYSIMITTENNEYYEGEFTL